MRRLPVRTETGSGAPHEPSRRLALQRLVGGAIGIAMTRVAQGEVETAPIKMSKTSVGYVDAGRIAGQDCDDCVHFLAGATAKAPGRCRIVDGDINPHGHCIAFSPRPKK